VRTTRLKVTLRDVEPKVLRVLDVPADSTLGELHDLLQIAFGWLDLEPYQFVSGAAGHLPGGLGDVLDDLGERFGYLYDPQVRWEHDVLVLGPGGAGVACVYGEEPGPPDSSGGPRAYTQQRQSLDPRIHELFWAPHPPEFDQELTDLRVRQMAGLVPESVRLLLHLLGERVELSPGGELAPELTRPLLDQRPLWPSGGRPDRSPVVALQGILRSTGILRQSGSGLAPAPSAADPRFLVRRLRSWFTPGSLGAAVAGPAVGGLAARGALEEETLVHLVLGEALQEQPIDAADVRQTLHRLLPALTGLDLAVRTPLGWVPGPSARTLLPQATALSVYAPSPCSYGGQHGPAIIGASKDPM
jgi:hypothetical protein